MLVRNGKLCRRCRGECLEGISKQEHAEIECPICSGEGCEHCDDGFFSLFECARTFTRELIRPMNMAIASDKGFLPVAGGLLDQSAWFLDLMTTLHNEQNKLDAEQAERRQ